MAKDASTGLTLTAAHHAGKKLPSYQLALARTAAHLVEGPDACIDGMQRLFPASISHGHGRLKAKSSD
jgi:hypothetical protein